jgi:MoaA/NifB/PqqE/SkfB family radical SAM enzyme
MSQYYRTASWMMSEFCNFDCHYCHSHTREREKALVSIDDLVKTLKRAHPTWIVAMTGGEPFLYPDFINVCERLVEAGFKIALDTNLSVTPIIKQFTKTIPANRVEYIYSSVHVLERERLYGSLDHYVENVLTLKKAGFPVQISYVLHPTLFSRLEKDLVYFAKQGLEVEPKPFSGIYKGKLYPAAYDEAEKKVLLRYNSKAFEKTTFFSKGLRCRAGKDLVRIWPNGTISRCVADVKPLGNAKDGVALLTKPLPCEVGWCPCFGFEYVIDPITKARIKKHMGDPKLSLWEIVKTPRVWRKGWRKLRTKGWRAIRDYV